MIERFLREGNNVNNFSRIFAEQQAPRPLIYPIIKMNLEGVKLLLDAGADPNISVGAFFRGPGNEPKYTHGNALVWAAGYTGVGVEIGSRKHGWGGDHSDYRASRKRFNSNRLKIIKLLLEYGANPYDTSSFGYTALDLVKMQRPNPGGRPVGTEKNDAEIIELLEDYMKIYYLQNPKQKLAFTSSMIPRLGYDTPLQHLDDYDILSKIMSYQIPHIPSVKLRMLDEDRKDPLIKSKQRSAIMRGMESMTGPFRRGVRYEPSIMEGISKHLSNIRPYPSVQRRMMLEDRQTVADNYDADGYDADGYDANGYDVDGYDVDGYDANGYDVDGYDVDGYDANGYDVYDYDVDGNKKQSAGYKKYRKRTKRRNRY